MTRGPSDERVAALADLYHRILAVSARRAKLFARLQHLLPLDEASRESVTRIDAAKKKLLKLAAARQALETELESGRRDLALRRSELIAKKAGVLRQMENVENARVRLADSADLMYDTTFNRLSITQQSLTYRRWELAQGVAHIFSLSAIDALRTPPASPSRHESADTVLEKRPRNISICGLELDSSVIKKNKETMLDQEIGNNSEKLATALGYVAHILQLLSNYFDLPLRYPVQPVNSRSYICDFVVPSSTTGGGGSGAAHFAETIKFPLYIDHVGVERERTRFAYAVFLLNKDIEQILNAHGLDAYGVAPHFTLSNLHKLLSYST